MLMCTEDCGEDQSAGIQLPRLAASIYPKRDTQVAASLLCLAVIKPISGYVRIACSGFMIASLLEVVNTL